MDFKIKTEFPARVEFEISINYDGFNYLVIYGKHINGYFCNVMNWGLCCEMSNPRDTFYNSDSLIKSGARKKAAIAIAEAIKQHAIQKENARNCNADEK